MTFDQPKKKSLRFPRHFGSNCLVWDENQQGHLNFSSFFDFPHTSIKALRGRVRVIHAVGVLDESRGSGFYSKKKPLLALTGAAL